MFYFNLSIFKCSILTYLSFIFVIKTNIIEHNRRSFIIVLKTNIIEDPLTYSNIQNKLEFESKILYLRLKFVMFAYVFLCFFMFVYVRLCSIMFAIENIHLRFVGSSHWTEPKLVLKYQKQMKFFYMFLEAFF